MGCTSHFGHLPMESSLIWMKVTHAISPHKLEVANNSLELETDIAATQTSVLVETRTGVSLEWHQLHYLKSKEKKRLVITGDISNPTAADRLIAYLSNNADISFMCLFAEFNSGLLTTKTKKMHSSNSGEISVFNDDTGDETESHEICVILLESQDLQKVSYCTCWTCDYCYCNN